MELYDANCITNFLSFKYLDIRDINNCLSTSIRNYENYKKSECIMRILNILRNKSYIDNSDLFYRIGGIKYIIDSINNNFKNKNILIESFRTLSNIIFKNDLNKMMVYSYGINNILLKSIRIDDNILEFNCLHLYSNMVIRSNEFIYDIVYDNRISYILNKIIKSDDVYCFRNGLIFIQNISHDKLNPLKNNVREYFSKIKINNKNIIDLLFDSFQKFYFYKNIIIKNFIRSLLNLILNDEIKNMLNKDIYINKLNKLYIDTNNFVVKKKIKGCLEILN